MRRWIEAALLLGLWVANGWLLHEVFRAEPDPPSCGVCGLDITPRQGSVGNRPRVREARDEAGQLIKVRR
jgi:hypothetical protein